MNVKYILIAFTLLALLFPIPAMSQDNLLIIAPDDFIDELQPLKRFKDASGRPTILVSLTDIYNNSSCSSSSRDNPETIKKCIADYEQTENIQFVLLVGDSDQFPVRYVRAYNTEWGSKYYPSDLYYADLYDATGYFDDWDGDNDNIIGEMDFAGGTDITKVNLDNINMYPDVIVSRMPASNASEVTTYVNKVINYELQAPGNWFNEALLVVDGGSSPFGSTTKMNAIIPYLSGFTITKRYLDDSPWDTMTNDQRGAEINSVLNNGVGFVNYHGHGNRTYWGGNNPGTEAWYTQNYLSALTNNDMLPVMFATSCYTARFHVDLEYYLDVNSNEWDQTAGHTHPANHPEPADVQTSTYDSYDNESFAEQFLVKRDSGAIGYIGSVSRIEHGAWLDTTHGLAVYFFEDYSQGTRNLGKLWKNALSKFIVDVENVGMGGYFSYIHIHKVTLFGDPALRVGGAFTTNLSGDIYDGNGGPLTSYSRYRITGDVTVPAGQRLTANSASSILFESGKKITAMDTNPSNGFLVNGTSNNPVYLLSSTIDLPSGNVVNGMKVRGQIRVRNGGEIKVY